MSPERQEAFALRVERWWPDLVDGLAGVYPHHVVEDLALRVTTMAAAAYRERDPELHRLDQRRLLRPDWLQQPEMFGYSTYADRFAGDLDGVARRIDYLRELGVTYLHLMPVLQTRPGDDDGGYAVTDYRSVRSELGTVADLRRLTAALRANGISLVLDLVLNHVAREHEWANRARAGEAEYQKYFYCYANRNKPAAYERYLPEVFPATAPGNFTFEEDLDAWVWTTFNSWQWDVNWSNPAVFAEYADIVFFLANLGVEVLRLDAVAFLWKRMGTNCQNQPEVHAITQALRALARMACPALAFKAEAIVGPADLVAYLGEGPRYGKVSDLAYHNTLMVQIWSLLATKDVRLAVRALRQMPPQPGPATWITYVRCHDDIGWAVDDDDCRSIGWDGGAHRAFLSDWFSGDYPTSPARGLVFQHNLETGDRRISGTSAALAGLDAARASGTVERELASESVARILLAHTIAAGFGGIPVLWSGDELGLGNDPHWADEPGHESDNRWASRPRIDWMLAERRHDPESVEGQVFQGLARVARVRASLPHLHASRASHPPRVTNHGVLELQREHPLGPMLCVYNITADTRAYPAWCLSEAGVDRPFDALSGSRIAPGDDGAYWLQPYAAWWLVNEMA